MKENLPQKRVVLQSWTGKLHSEIKYAIVAKKLKQIAPLLLEMYL